MRSTTLAWLTSLLLVPAAAQANPAFQGRFQLEGRYSSQRRTAATLSVTNDSQSLRITRIGRYTSAALSHLPPFAWQSQEVDFQGRLMRVTYRLSGGESVMGLLGALDPDALTVSGVSGVFSHGNTIEAVYALSEDGSQLREVAINTTRKGHERWWSWVSTRGRRITGPDDVPVVTLTTDHPGATLERNGEAYMLLSDETGSSAALGHRAVAELAFDGHVVRLQAPATGLFDAYELPRLVPAGYFAARVHHHSLNGRARTTFELRRDRPEAPTTEQAIARAKRGLLEHIRTDRMNDGDWLDYFPGTWPELLAAGIVGKVDAFFADPATEVHRHPDRYTFVGRGPYELYTEVSVSKVDGHIISAYIEID